jgi:hypothetical protein
MTITSNVIDFAAEYRWHLLAAFVAVYFARSYAEYSRLKAFKGPWLAGRNDLWFAKAAFSINQCGVLAEVCETYGTVRTLPLQFLVDNKRDAVPRNVKIAD